MKEKNEEPIWNPENMNKKKGDTTFVTCGWCEHRGCGTCRYNCMLSGDCSLMRNYDGDVKWNSECKVIQLGKADIENIIGSKDYDIKGYEDSIERRKAEIATLKTLQKNAIDIPPLPWSRKYNHFNLNDEVMRCFAGKWKHGIVVYGYRHHDGCVSFHLTDGSCICKGRPPKELDTWKDIKEEKQQKEMKELEGRIGSLAQCAGCGIQVPSVMLKKEYDWFASNSVQYQMWIKESCNREYNGEKLSIHEFPQPKCEK